MGTSADGTLSHGKKTTSHLRHEEIELFLLPNAEWAPAPFNKSSVSTVNKVMSRFGCEDDTARLCRVGKNIHSLKSRLLDGLVHLSDSRWAERDLNNPRHFNTACEHLTAVIVVFEYLNMLSDLQKLQGALNARRKLQNPTMPDLDLVGLWEEPIRAKYEVMTGAAHSWVLSRVTGLRQQTLGDYCSLSRIERIFIMADLMIWMSMDGYHGYQPSAEIAPGLQYPDLDPRRKSYHRQLDQLCYDLLKSSQLPPIPWIELVLCCQKEKSKRPLEEREQHGFGFVVYRAAYKVSDEEWETVKRNTEAHLAAWGDGIQGAEQVKPLLKLHWFDCKELGLDPSDTAAAKSHFQQLRESDPYQHKINPHIFLMIDDWSSASYKHKPHPALETAETCFPGNSVWRGRLLAVDPDLDPYHAHDGENVSVPATSYADHMRILGNLVWSELFAMLTMSSAQLEDPWPLAMDNPQKVYTGPTVPSQVREWKSQNAIRIPADDVFAKWLEKKNPEMEDTVKRHRKMHVW
ncbi:hypothetical protein BDW68DRAFT_185564 [Aspergillus falconensis]